MRELGLAPRDVVNHVRHRRKVARVVGDLLSTLVALAIDMGSCSAVPAAVGDPGAEASSAVPAAAG
eukprot:9494379-Lingulodinium_polyedra.AAC.1